MEGIIDYLLLFGFNNVAIAAANKGTISGLGFFTPKDKNSCNYNLYRASA